MLKLDSTLLTLVVAALVAAGVGYGVRHVSLSPGDLQFMAAVPPKAAEPTPRPSEAAAVWAATAPGRVEPRSGELRIASGAAGRILQVLVAPNDPVIAERPLVRLDDADALARIAAAEAEVAVRRRERDAETVARLAADRRVAEDAYAGAQSALFEAQLEFDRLVMRGPGAAAPAAEIDELKARVDAAAARLEQERQNVRRVQAQAGMPLYTRLESSLAAARAELRLAESALDRTRVRSPISGTALRVDAKVGELAAPGPEAALVTIGDLSLLRVRAEVEERDAAKVREAHQVTVKSPAYEGREFTGRVARIARSIGSPHIANRGPRRASDVDVLEVLIDLEGTPPLLPGMRVDVFFKAELVAPVARNASPTAAN